MSGSVRTGFQHDRCHFGPEARILIMAAVPFRAGYIFRGSKMVRFCQIGPVKYSTMHYTEHMKGGEKKTERGGGGCCVLVKNTFAKLLIHDITNK